jgi:hypothetical protein
MSDGMLNAESLPANSDLSVKFIDGGFVGKLPREILRYLSVVGIPGVPALEKRSLRHDSSEGAVSNVPMTV